MKDVINVPVSVSLSLFVDRNRRIILDKIRFDRAIILNVGLNQGQELERNNVSVIFFSLRRKKETQ